MNLIAFIGLVTIEKIRLVQDLARYYTWDAGQSVTIIDNVARMAIDPVHLSGETLIRFEDDISDKLAFILKEHGDDVVLLAISETAHLDELLVTFDEVTTTNPDIQLHTIGLLDLRTCDCFPHYREQLESYTETTLLAPFSVNAVLGAMNP